MALENFSGTSAEAVKQDFYATLYLSGLESLLTESAQMPKTRNTRKRSKNSVTKRYVNCAGQVKSVVRTVTATTLSNADGIGGTSSAVIDLDIVFIFHGVKFVECAHAQELDLNKDDLHEMTEHLRNGIDKKKPR